MKTVIINAATNPNGITTKLAQKCRLSLADFPQDSATVINLADYDLRMNAMRQTPNDWHYLHDALSQADLWVIVTPVYLKSIAGSLQQLLELLRPTLYDCHPSGRLTAGQFKNKHYVLATTCYATPAKNWWFKVTLPLLAKLDEQMQQAGLVKAGELVVTNTWQNHQLTSQKQAEIMRVMQTAKTKVNQKKSAKGMLLLRYLLLLVVVAITSLAAMGLENVIVSSWTAAATFWGRWGIFVVIFYALLALCLHGLTLMMHKFK